MKVSIFLIPFVFFATSVLASEGRVRQLFLQVEAAQDSGDRMALERHRDELADYPLLPYLEAAQLRQQFGQASGHADEKALNLFFQQNENTPYSSDLRSDWLQWLAQRNDAAGYLLFYRPMRDIGLQCQYLSFALANDDPASKSAAAKRREFTGLWLTDKSLPSSCAAAEKFWTKQGELTDNRLWQRLQMAIAAGNNNLTAELRKRVVKTDQALLDQWLKFRANPTLLLKPVTLKGDGVHQSLALADLLEQLVWRDRDQALTAFAIQKADTRLMPADSASVHYSFALALATGNHPAARDWLATVPPERLDDRIMGWRIVDPMRKLQWNDTEYWINQVPDKGRQNNRWRYFHARTSAALGQTERAGAAYRDLLSSSDYYSLLARAQLNIREQPMAPALNVSAEVLTRVRQMPVMARAQEWLALDRISAARREWNTLLYRMSPEELQAAAIIANEWQWSDRALLALKQAQVNAGWDLQYPFVNADTMTAEANKRDVDLSWAYAITRQESLFASDAKSGAGALGLMQIMPSTARLIARRYKLPFAGEHELIRPVNNIRIGVALLGDLAIHNKGNLVYATAAYNAGQSRVDVWQQRDGHLPLDIWIETIPFRETQNYVKQVASFSLIYATRLSRSPTVFEQIANSMQQTSVVLGNQTNTIAPD